MESLLTLVERLFFTPPSFADPLTTGIMALLGTALLVSLVYGAPIFLLILFLEWVSRRPSQARSAAERDRLLRREARRRAHLTARLQQAHARQEAFLLSRPLTIAQQAFYDDMRAQGWSELASRQAAERRTA